MAETVVNMYNDGGGGKEEREREEVGEGSVEGEGVEIEQSPNSSESSSSAEDMRKRSIDALIDEERGQDRGEEKGVYTDDYNDYYEQTHFDHAIGSTGPRTHHTHNDDTEWHHLYGEDFSYEVDWPYHPFSLWMLFGVYAKHVNECPKGIVWALTLVAWNAILMAVAEILIEILMVAGAIPKIEFRAGFLVLTLLSALLALHTFADLIDNELGTTVQVMRISLVVEVGLVFADLMFILIPEDDPQWLRAAYRSPFMVLTAVNVCLVMYTVIRLRIIREVFGTPYLFSCIPFCRRVRKKIQREERERKFEERIIRNERRSREMQRGPDSVPPRRSKEMKGSQRKV